MKVATDEGTSTIDQIRFGEAGLEDMETFIRDTNFAPGVLEKYKKGLVLQETGYIDVSEFQSGPLAHVRYHVITSMANEFREGFTSYGAWTIPRGSFFKVIDVVFKESNVLISLLQIREDQINNYARHPHPDEAELAKASCKRFLHDLNLPPNPALDDAYWLKRTAFPIGIADDGTYFYQVDNGQQANMDPKFKLKGLFRRWFGKS